MGRSRPAHEPMQCDGLAYFSRAATIPEVSGVVLAYSASRGEIIRICRREASDIRVDCSKEAKSLIVCGNDFDRPLKTKVPLSSTTTSPGRSDESCRNHSWSCFGSMLAIFCVARVPSRTRAVRRTVACDRYLRWRDGVTLISAGAAATEGSEGLPNKDSKKPAFAAPAGTTPAAAKADANRIGRSVISGFLSGASPKTKVPVRSSSDNEKSVQLR
jgi:hypothetical protein